MHCEGRCQIWPDTARNIGKVANIHTGVAHTFISLSTTDKNIRNMLVLACEKFYLPGVF